ncbi:EamA family transporter RarD [Ectopseudomonas hydrolytica]|uniref:EamA family transporter RarD n=1 Tax=Ectopseudomonas hydrolytica TaxID=2493633 RepID=A0ABY5AB23_9GAMM|nr:MULTISPECIES: EamA family transporter RarD [Pseudomonas]ATH83182.1 protein RarD [Pseudomonas mendocina]MDH0096323.1 EamA family transporter RarD [Pseudomonas sp. GD04158]USR41092.1 EamA family transporter RarD [Pseudomonas hydrolytica]UTH37811.1 EamA family transporter RarD [Pseudomonas sp. KHPS1]
MLLSGRGVALSVGASVLFALLPGYVQLLAPLDGIQIFAQRVLWSIPLVLLLVLLTRQGALLRETFARLRREPLLVAAWPVAAVLIGVQWGLFLWAPLAGRMLEVSMGYFLLPLAMVLAGRLFYNERLRPLQQLAVACAVVGVLHELWRTQAFSWLTLVTALGYPPYFMLRRWMRLDALSGFVLEMLMLAPLAIWLILAYGPAGAFEGRTALWLLVPGMALIGTLAFAAMMASSRLLPMGLFGILSYVEPVLLFAVALLVLGERFDAGQWLTYLPIWLAVLLVGWDSARLLRKQQLER